jgi:hypothetical protein
MYKPQQTRGRLPATIFAILHRWTFYSTVTAKHAAIALLRFQNSFTIFAFVEILTGIGGHFLFFFMTTNRTGYC